MRIYSRISDNRSTPFAERERPAVMHSAVHETREAKMERPVDMHPEFDVSHAYNPTSLRAPPPRAGFMQRWVADGTNPTTAKADQLNWHGKARKGWVPRDPETVPADLRRLYPSQKLHDGQTAIRVAGMVLCELPIRVAKAYGEAIRGRIQMQSKSVPDSVQELNKRAVAMGASPLEVEDGHTAYRGRKAAAYTE